MVNLIYCQLKWSWIVRCKDKTQNTSLFLLSFKSQFLHSSALSSHVAQGIRHGLGPVHSCSPLLLLLLQLGVFMGCSLSGKILAPLWFPWGLHLLSGKPSSHGLLCRMWGIPAQGTAVLPPLFLPLPWGCQGPFLFEALHIMGSACHVLLNHFLFFGHKYL